MIPQGRTRIVATVFGGSGFIGRYVVSRLASRGYTVRVAVRDPEGALFLKPRGTVGQIVPLYASITEDGTVRRAIEGADVVVNLVGILAQKNAGDFNRIHAEGAGRIARLTAELNGSTLVHISAIGADPSSPSRYASSKGRGEALVREAFPRAVILRPSIVFGQEDQFFNRFATLAQFLPVMPVISGSTRMQPVYVGDVADAVMAALDRAEEGGLFELGGPRVWTFREILAYVPDRDAPQVPHDQRSDRPRPVAGSHFRVAAGPAPDPGPDHPAVAGQRRDDRRPGAAGARHRSHARSSSPFPLTCAAIGRAAASGTCTPKR